MKTAEAVIASPVAAAISGHRLRYSDRRALFTRYTLYRGGSCGSYSYGRRTQAPTTTVGLLKSIIIIVCYFTAVAQKKKASKKYCTEYWG